MQLFSADDTVFFKEYFFHPQKLLRNIRNTQFFFTLSYQNGPKRRIHVFQNVAYRPTVYKTGVFAHCIGCHFKIRMAILQARINDCIL